MADNVNNPQAVSRHSKLLRAIGVSVLVLGIAAAGMVYWIGTRSPDVSDDPSMAGFTKARDRQMEILYGKMGSVMEKWSDDLKEPGTQAILILTVAALGAYGCFYFARLPDDEEPR